MLLVEDFEDLLTCSAAVTFARVAVFDEPTHVRYFGEQISIPLSCFSQLIFYDHGVNR